MVASTTLHVISKENNCFVFEQRFPDSDETYLLISKQILMTRSEKLCDSKHKYKNIRILTSNCK